MTEKNLQRQTLAIEHDQKIGNDKLKGLNMTKIFFYNDKH